MAAHAVIFANDPPALLNVAAVIQREILIAGGEAAFLTAHEKRCERLNLVFGQVQIGHAELFSLRLDFAEVPNVGFRELVLEKAFLVIPRGLCRAFGKAREIVGVRDGFVAAALRGLREKSKVQTLDWLTAFRGKLRADAAFLLEASDFVTARAAKEANPLFTLFLELGIVHECGIGICRWLLLLQGNQVAGHILGILRRKPQAGHDGHVLNLQLVPVVWAPAVVQVKYVRETFLCVILGADIFLFEHAIGASTFTSVVNPADEIVVVVLFADASKIGRESSPLHLGAFSDGVTGKTAARLKQFFTVRGVSGLMFGQGIRQARLPNVGGDRFNLFVV